MNGYHLSNMGINQVGVNEYLVGLTTNGNAHTKTPKEAFPRNNQFASHSNTAEHRNSSV